ncbi:hypothetical protein KXJ74_14235 [Acinetobacter johnsonii]|nr:hypothetical protein KXJ74_14235 [Acinetobacter johnsonii]
MIPPIFEERSNSFIVVMKHKRLASIEDVIIDYFENNPDAFITNKLVRQLSGEGNINKVKVALKKLRSDGKIEVVDRTVRAFDYQYKILGKK